MLEVRELSSGYGRNVVLHNISFRVGENEIVAIIGSNGAGKTTTLRTISGLVKPVSGKVYFCGHPIDAMDPSEISRQKLIHVP